MKSFIEFFKNTLSIIGVIASIAGVLIVIFKEATTIILLVAFCIFLLIILIKVFFTLDKLIRLKTDLGYENISSMLKYSTDDGINIEFNMYKVIQSKKMIFTEFNSEYKWDGKSKAKISSTLQEIKFIKDDNIPQTYDVAILKLKKPILYNQSELIHFCGKSFDQEGISKKEIEVKVQTPYRLIHFIAELKHKTDSTKAYLRKRKINSDVSYIETLTAVDFDNQTKKYEYFLIEPEVGYFYKLEWT